MLNKAMHSVSALKIMMLGFSDHRKLVRVKTHTSDNQMPSD